MSLRSLIIYNIISVSSNFLVGSISHQTSSYCILDSIMYTLVVIISLIGSPNVVYYMQITNIPNLLFKL